ncbi:putative nuclease HARBI1 [Heterodontus francisci]|uniref:putative nuclease HARBI1 n=1 Tax=Heterodontus francisci TaxID=7792 RepID=UPI00355B57BE
MDFGGHPMPVALKITVALNFYTSGSFQGSTEDMCGVCHSVAQCCIKEVTNALFRRAGDYVHFRTDRESQAKRAIGIGVIVGFPQVQGVIDCTHVAIKASMDQPAVFINRKSFHLCNLYATTESASDKCVPTFREAATTHSYFGTTRNPSNDAEEHYNTCHGSTRATIEQTIGMLKIRFRCLNNSGGALQYVLQKVGCIIVACCILHNIALQRGEALPGEEMWEYETSSDEEDTEGTQDQAATEDPSRVMEGRHLEQRAREARQSLIMEHF